MAAINRGAFPAALVLLVACGDGEAPGEHGAVPPTHVSGAPDRRRVVDRGDGVPERPRERAAYVHSASRCGECHTYALEQWESSAHAHASRSPLFVAARRGTADPAACSRCHAPLAASVPAADPIATEGVACDACHAVRDVTIDDRSASMELRLEDNVKYASLCDAEDHYFHRMGCSDLHASARFCAGCHHLVREVDGTALSIYSEFSEWQDGPYAAEGVDCQFCHMPVDRGTVATGSGERDGVSHHGFLGVDGDLRRRAIDVRVRARGSGEVVEVEVDVRNRRAGHRIPSGVPGRRLRIRAIARGDDGVELGRAQRDIGRVLVDADGREVQHHDAIRELRDDRIAPRETRTFSFAMSVADACEIVVEVAWRELSDDLAAAMGIVGTEQILARSIIPVGPPATRRRVGRVRSEGAQP